MKKVSLVIWLTIVFAAIAFLFWRNEWVYNLPTPVPKNYHAVNQGTDMTAALKLDNSHQKPLFLHFFNPACPCSRFNMTHFKSLVKEYGDKVDFRIVTMSSKQYTEKDIQDKFEMPVPVPVIFDTTLATACGVYSTPQAVIVDNTHRLYYRGNYNRSRYCADKKTEYARIALDSLLHNNHPAVFDQYALKAYGCQLPNCDN